MGKSRRLSGSRLRERLELLALVYVTSENVEEWNEGHFLTWLHQAQLDKFLYMLKRRSPARLIQVLRKMGYRDGKKIDLVEAHEKKRKIYKKLYDEMGRKYLL